MHAAEQSLSVLEQHAQKLKLVTGFGAFRVLSADKEAEEYVKAEEANKLAKEARTKKQDYQRKPRTYNNQN